MQRVNFVLCEPPRLAPLAPGRAGALDQRVTLEQRVEGQDEAGQPFEDWLPVFDAWAAVEPLRGKEVIRADAVASITDVLVKLRYRPGVLASMRIKHGSDTYSIATVINIKSANREAELLCKRVA